ncbi:MAG: DUF3598 family protein [Calothrix sp. MO_167.B12]|nr:DUF3598 family protein [Calothrix sp. MO_167.B12]
MRSQWECFLQTLGVWEGSFTRLSAEGNFIQDIPSRLTLEGLDNNQKIKLTLCREGLNDIVLDFTPQSIGDVIFFDNGAFSQGAVQFSPAAQFGGELGLIHENRRLRLVQLFDTSNQLSQITLIREHRAGVSIEQRPQLKIEELLGEWQGEAITIYPDLRPANTCATKMQLQLDNNGQLQQTLDFAERTITSIGTIKGTQILFEQNPQNPVQVLMLPDGASATAPLKAQLGQSLFLEVGWLIEPTLRQRMIRSYNQKGEWVSLTLVVERKIS